MTNINIKKLAEDFNDFVQRLPSRVKETPFTLFTFQSNLLILIWDGQHYMRIMKLLDLWGPKLNKCNSWSIYKVHDDLYVQDSLWRGLKWLKSCQ